MTMLVKAGCRAFPLTPALSLRERENLRPTHVTIMSEAVVRWSGRRTWLPAPAGSFNVMFRMYWPKDEILTGKWFPPAVTQD